MKHLLLLALVLLSLSTFSQLKNIEISGKIINLDTKLPLESATIYLQRVKDSSIITYTISDKKGAFLIENRTVEKLVDFYVSYNGYKTYYKRLKLDKPKLSLKNILLSENTNELDAIVIMSQAPITIKKDTLEFNVKSFKTKKNANIEDLLRELPGVEVSEAGKIKINGKEVNKVLLNGKPFFGNDPTIATRNLSKDIIKKIQVSDTKTDDEAFTGEKGKQTNKTINLVIDKDKNKGVFGKIAAGLGTDKRNEYAGMFNRFDNDLRISALVGGNNINEPGFSFGEIRKMFGGQSGNVNNQLFGFGNGGINTSNNVGVNFVDTWGKKVDPSANYFYSNSNSVNDTKSNRETILPDNSSFFTNYNSTTNGDVQKHSIETKVLIKPDSMLRITIKPQYRATTVVSNFTNNETSLNEDSELINESNSTSSKETSTNFFSNNINMTRKYGANGGFYKLNIFNNLKKTATEDLFKSDVAIFGNTPSTITRNQLNDIKDSNATLNIGTVFRIYLIKKLISIDLEYNYKKYTEENIRNSFDFNTTKNQFENTINTDLSSNFSYKNTVSLPGFDLHYQKKRWSTTLSTKYVFRTLENNDFLRPQFSLKRKFNAVKIRSTINYRSPKSSFGLKYNLENTPPKLSQLQTFVDITNPLNLTIGNPDLAPVNNHNFSFYYNKNNYQKGNNFYAYIISRFENNKIVAKQTVDSDLIRRTTFTNTNGNFDARAYIDYSKKVKLDTLNKKTLNIHLGIHPSIRRAVNFFNGVQYAANSSTISPNLNFNFNWRKITDISLSYNLRYTKNSFDIESLQQENFTVHSIYSRSRTDFGKKLEWSNVIRYNYNPNVADGFQKSAWFWNSTLAYSILKDKATLSLKAYDILNQNTNARRIINQNFIEDRQSTVLQRYVMLSFSWKFNTLGKKGEVNDSSRYIIR
jgi:hypothetical protein